MSNDLLTTWPDVSNDSQNVNDESESYNPKSTASETPPPKKRGRKPRQKTTTPPNQPIGISNPSENDDTPPKVGRKSSLDSLKDDVAALYFGVGTLVLAFDSYDGMVIISGADKRATEVVNVARHNKRFLAFLKRLTKASDIGALILGHASMVGAILGHHNMLPALPGVPKSSVPESNDPSEHGPVSQTPIFDLFHRPLPFGG